MRNQEAAAIGHGAGEIWNLIVANLGATQGHSLAQLLGRREEIGEAPADPDLLSSAAAALFAVGARVRVPDGLPDRPSVPVVFRALDDIAVAARDVAPALAELIDWWYGALIGRYRTGLFQNGQALGPDLRRELVRLLEPQLPILTNAQRIGELDAALSALRDVADQAKSIPHAPHAIFRKAVRDLRRAVETGQELPELLLVSEPGELMQGYVPRRVSPVEREEIEGMVGQLLAAVARVAATAAMQRNADEQLPRPQLPRSLPAQLNVPLAAALSPVLVSVTDLEGAVARMLSGAESAPRMTVALALILRAFGREPARVAACLSEYDALAAQLKRIADPGLEVETARAALGVGDVLPARELVRRETATHVADERRGELEAWIAELKQHVAAADLLPALADAAGSLLVTATAEAVAGEIDAAAASAAAAARVAALPEQLERAPWERTPDMDADPGPPAAQPPDDSAQRLADEILASYEGPERVNRALSEAIRTAQRDPELGVSLLAAVDARLHPAFRAKLSFHRVEVLRRLGRDGDADALAARLMPPVPAEIVVGTALPGSDLIQPEAKMPSVPVLGGQDAGDYARALRLEEEEGDVLQAARELERMLRRQHRHWLAALVLGKYIVAGAPEEALAVYRDVCTRTWVTGKMSWNIGCAYASIGLQAEALASFRVFVENVPSVLPERWRPVQALFTAAGEQPPPAPAKAIYAHPPAKPPASSTPNRTQRARVLAEQGAHEEALALLREILADNANSPAGEQLIKVLTQLGRLEEAIQAIDALEPHRMKPMDRLRLARAAVDAGQLQIAGGQLRLAGERGAGEDELSVIAERIKRQRGGARLAGDRDHDALVRRARAGTLSNDEWAGLARELIAGGRLVEAIDLAQGIGAVVPWAGPALVGEVQRAGVALPEDPVRRRGLIQLVGSSGDLEAVIRLSQLLPPTEAVALTETAEWSVPAPARPVVWGRRRRLLIELGEHERAAELIAARWPPMPPDPLPVDETAAVALAPLTGERPPTRTSWDASVGSGSVSEIDWSDPEQAADAWSRYVRAGRRGGVSQAVGWTVRLGRPGAALELVREALAADWRTDDPGEDTYVTAAATWNIAAAYAAVGDLKRAARALEIYFLVTPHEPEPSAVPAIERIFAAVERPLPRFVERGWAATMNAVPPDLRSEVERLREQPSPHEFTRVAKQLREAIEEGADPMDVVAVAEELFERCRPWSETVHVAMARVLEVAASRGIADAAERAWLQHIVPIADRLGTGTAPVAQRLAKQLGRLDELETMVKSSPALAERHRLGVLVRIADDAGEPERARELARELLKVDPESQLAQQRLADPDRSEPTPDVRNEPPPGPFAPDRARLRESVLGAQDQRPETLLPLLSDLLGWLATQGGALLVPQPVGPDSRSPLAEEHRRVVELLLEREFAEAANQLEPLVHERPGDSRLAHDLALAYLHLVERRGLTMASTVPGLLGRLLRARWTYSEGERSPYDAERLLADAPARGVSPELRADGLAARAWLLAHPLQAAAEASAALLDGLALLPPATAAEVALDALAYAAGAGDRKLAASAVREVRARPLASEPSAAVEWAVGACEYRWALVHAEDAAAVIRQLEELARNGGEAPDIAEALLDWVRDEDDVADDVLWSVARVAAKSGQPQRGLDEAILAIVDQWPSDPDREVVTKFKERVRIWAGEHGIRWEDARRQLLKRMQSRGIELRYRERTQIRGGGGHGELVGLDRVRLHLIERDSVDLDASLSQLGELRDELAEDFSGQQSAIEQAFAAWRAVVKLAASTLALAGCTVDELTALSDEFDAALAGVTRAGTRLSPDASRLVGPLEQLLRELHARAIDRARGLAEAGTRFEVQHARRVGDPRRPDSYGPVELALRLGVTDPQPAGTLVRVQATCGDEAEDERIFQLTPATRRRDVVMLLPSATPVQPVKVRAEFPSLDKTIEREESPRVFPRAAHERATSALFGPGNPQPTLFRGREDEQSLIRRHFTPENPPVLLLYGRRQIGKSSLARSVQTAALVDKAVTVFADCQLWPDTPSYRDGRDVAGWLAETIAVDPEAWESLGTALAGVRSFQALANALRRAAKAGDAGGRHVLLILDEFQVVLDAFQDERERQNLANQLRALASDPSVPLSMMVLGSCTRRRWEAMLSGSYLLQEIGWLELGSLSDTVVEEVLRAGFASREIMFVDGAVRRFCDTVRGYPIHVHYLGEAVAEALGRHKRFVVDASLVAEATAAIEGTPEHVLPLLRPDGKTLALTADNERLLERVAWLAAAFERADEEEPEPRRKRLLQFLEEVIADQENAPDDDAHVVLDACLEAGLIDEEVNTGRVRWVNDLVREGVRAELRRQDGGPAVAGANSAEGMEFEDVDEILAGPTPWYESARPPRGREDFASVLAAVGLVPLDRACAPDEALVSLDGTPLVARQIEGGIPADGEQTLRTAFTARTGLPRFARIAPEPASAVALFEPVNGTTLREVAAERPVRSFSDVVRMVDFVARACEIVAHAQRDHGLVHRHLTPSSVVIVEPGETVVVDGWRELGGGPTEEDALALTAIVVALLSGNVPAVFPPDGGFRVHEARAALEDAPEELVDEDLFAILDAGLGDEDGGGYEGADELGRRLGRWRRSL